MALPGQLVRQAMTVRRVQLEVPGLPVPAAELRDQQDRPVPLVQQVREGEPQVRPAQRAMTAQLAPPEWVSLALPVLQATME